MYSFVYYIILILLNPQLYLNIEQKNKFIEDFNRSMQASNYKGAVESFEVLQSIDRVIDSHLRLVAAHAYLALNDTTNARINYEFSQDISNKDQSSISRNQLGILALMRGDSATAISYFRSAIERNSDLKEAKFNFELISSLYNPSSPPQHVENESSEQVVLSEERQKELEEYESEKISKERALQLLDNLRISETKGIVSKKISENKIEKDW